MTGMILNRDAIIDADDLNTETIEVPEWKGSVIIRSLTGQERDQFEMSVLEKRKGNIEAALGKMVNFRARLVALTVVDEDGDRLFSDSDVLLLAKKNASAISRIFDASRKLSGLSESDVEELEGNLEPDPSEDSVLD